MASDLDSLIAKRKAESAKRHRELEVYDAETRGLEKARELGPRAPGPALTLIEATPSYKVFAPTSSETFMPKRGGRQPGAISREWRGILRQLYFDKPHGFKEDDVVTYASLELIALKPKDARIRMEKYQTQGFIEVRDGLFFVTVAAGRKFGFVPPADSFEDLTGLKQ